MSVALAMPLPLAVPAVTASPWLLVNPRSFRARGRLGARARTLAERFNAGIVEVSEPASITLEVERLRALRRSPLFVLAGDGTVQAIVQHLALLAPGEWRPELMFLGGGRSNITARAFAGKTPLRTLKSALHRCSAGLPLSVQDRPLLRVEQAGSTPQHGFLLATGAIDQGIRLCRDHRDSGVSWMHKGPFADAYTLARIAFRCAFKRSPLPPYSQLEIANDRGEQLRGASRLIIVTTLQQRIGSLRLFADRGSGPVRITAIAAAATGFWRRLPRILLGRFTQGMNVDNGYLSGRCERVEIMGLNGYSLDGERFNTDPARPVIIHVGPKLRILEP